MCFRRRPAADTYQPTFTTEHAAHNDTISKRLFYDSGVYRVECSREIATLCADYLDKNWVGGKLTLGSGAPPDGMVARGYDSYPVTVVQPFDAPLQRNETLLLPGDRLPLVRMFLPGFAAVERLARKKLAEDNVIRPEGRIRLLYSHALRQGPDSGASSLFASHRDDEVVNPNGARARFTVIFKLTPDVSGEPASRMLCAGAFMPFEYGPGAGDGCWFQSALYNESLPHRSRRTHLNLALFFDVDEPPAPRRNRCQRN